MHAMGKLKSLSLRLIPLSKAPLPLFMIRATALTQPASGAGDTNVHSSDKPAEFFGEEGARQKDDDVSIRSFDLNPPTCDEPKENVPPFATSGKLRSHEVTRSSKGPIFQQKRRFSNSSRRDPHRVEGDREYYKHHKPSSLSNIEFADTRKPITRASDGGASALDVEGGEGRGMMLEDTVDEALERAERMFREAAARGDPTWPHSRALARMLRMREREQQG